MIEVKCDNCGGKMELGDEAAGTTVNCANCGSAIQAPGAPAAAAPAAATGGAEGGPTVVVQVQQPAGMVAPSKKSKELVFILSWVWSGLQYFYLGQIGKGILFSIVTLVLWFLAVVTCGAGLLVLVPYIIVLLVDSFSIAGRMSRGEAVSPWKFF